MGDGDVLVRAEGSLGRITLNRPDALNALTLGMVRRIDAALDAWEHDRGIAVVLIDGAGERGLCAGGDIRAIYDAARSGDLEPARLFWDTEYRLNARLATYRATVVAVMAGLVMGGGVGISAHCRHRIVTDTTKLAMPEVGIGFLPDVGGTYLLSRAPGELGTHVGLTAGRVGPADALLLGFADVHVPTNRLSGLLEELRSCPAADVPARLAAAAEAPSGGDLAFARPWIDAAYAADTVEAIVEALESRPEPGAAAALAALRANSPTSLKVTLRALRRAKRLGTLEACLEMELHAALVCLAGHDMPEGIRAAIIDKDRKPRWSPGRIEAVTTAAVAAHFRD